MKSFPVLTLLVNVVALALLLPAVHFLFWSFDTFGERVFSEFKILLTEFLSWFSTTVNSMGMAGEAFVKSDPFISSFIVLAFYVGFIFIVSTKARAAFPAWYEKYKNVVGLVLLGIFFWVVAGTTKPNQELNYGPVEAWVVSKVIYMIAVGFFYAAIPVETKYRINTALASFGIRIKTALLPVWKRVSSKKPTEN